MDNLNFSLPPGGIVGIIGPNGAGKTTLFRMLTGAEKPDGGAIRIGPTVKLAYVDQSRQTLDDKKTVWQDGGDYAPKALQDPLDIDPGGQIYEPWTCYVVDHPQAVPWCSTQGSRRRF